MTTLPFSRYSARSLSVRLVRSVACTAGVWLAACSADDATQAVPGDRDAAAPAAGGQDAGRREDSGREDSGTPHTNGRDEQGRIVEECQGFELDGLKYSPGGDTLPNTCAPFDALLNNPYAVRCIDALPHFKTPFPGDEYCILPPPEDLGVQVGVHPQGADYWNQIWAGDYSGYENLGPEWILEPGDERTQNYIASAGSTGEHNYYRTYFRMRTGSHHNIITLHRDAGETGWTSGSLPGLFDQSNGDIIGVLGGQQRPDDGTPQSFEKPPEDDGLYLPWPDNPDVLYNMHHFNVTPNDVLREGWVNIWWEPDARVRARWYMGMGPDQIAMNVPPGETVDYHYSWTVEGDEPVRLLRVFGHRHFWTTNFTAWIERAGEEEPEIIYQSFDWEDMPTFRYDSVVENHRPDSELHIDGATDGVTLLNPGDEYHFNCHIEYTDERASAHSAAPRPEDNGNLHFRNEAFNGEMCINFGNISGGGSLGSLMRDDRPVPEAATH